MNLLILICFFCVIKFQGCTGDGSKNQQIIKYLIPYRKFNEENFRNFKKWEIDKEAVILYADEFGNSTVASDLSAKFTTNWSKKGLMLSFEIIDDKYYVDSLNPDKSDAIEIFLSPYRGSSDIIRLTVLPESSTFPVNTHIYEKNYRKSGSIKNIPVGSVAYAKRDKNKNFINVLVPLRGLGIEPEINSKLAVQINIKDFDDNTGILKNQYQWYPVGISNENSFAMETLILAKKGKFYSNETSKCYITDNKDITLIIFSNHFKRSDILIKKNNELLLHSESINFFPCTFKFLTNKVNPEEDTINVYFNGRHISSHDLFNSSRKYEFIPPPGRYENEIRFFEALDRIFHPPDKGILFIGSSTIKGWSDLDKYFPGMNIIQRGFGGSTAEDVLFYFNRIVAPYKPSKIIYYEGDNDLARGLAINDVLNQIDTFLAKVNKQFPGTNVYVLTPKPSFARFKLMEKYLTLNDSLAVIKNYYPFTTVIDVASLMFDKNGDLRDDLFLSDGLHLNEKGYQIWGEKILKEINDQ